jgi:hypothetical protein
MSVVVEFMIPAEAFAFGAALSTDPPLKIEIERILQPNSVPVPYVWASQGAFDDFEGSVSTHESVRACTRLDETEERRLYRIDWDPADGDLIKGIAETEGAILQASGASTWTFQLRFPNEDRLSEFYSFVSGHDVALDVENVYVLAEQTRQTPAIDLTMEQREALTLAVRRGFYKVPRSITLADLAGDLGVSNQAASERIRRGTDRVLRPVLLGRE